MQFWGYRQYPTWEAFAQAPSILVLDAHQEMSRRYAQHINTASAAAVGVGIAQMALANATSMNPDKNYEPPTHDKFLPFRDQSKDCDREQTLEQAISVPGAKEFMRSLSHPHLEKSLWAIAVVRRGEFGELIERKAKRGD